MTDDAYPKTIINAAKVARLGTVELECKLGPSFLGGTGHLFLGAGRQAFCSSK